MKYESTLLSFHFSIANTKNRGGCIANASHQIENIYSAWRLEICQGR
jgi:hypothetical protein